MRGSWLVFGGLSAAVALMGCSFGTESSNLSDDAQVKIHGVYKNADGSPYSQKEVALYRNDLGGCGSLSWLVLGSDAPFAGDTTDTQGNFLFSATGAQTKGFANTALCFTVTTRNPEQWGVFQRQYTAYANFTVQQTDVQVPELRPWDGQATATHGNGLYQLSWTDLLQTHGYPAKDYSVQITSDKGMVWAASAGSALSLNVPEYILEDLSSLSWAPTAHAPVDQSGTTFDRYMTGKGVTLSNAASNSPLSRGATCASEVQSPIAALTDGSFTYVSLGAQPQGSTTTQYPTWVSVDLGSAKDVQRVVLRDLGTTVQLNSGQTAPAEVDLEIDGSQDGVTFTKIAGPFAAVPGNGYLDLDLGGAHSARYVRVAYVQPVQGKAMFDHLDEISVW